MRLEGEGEEVGGQILPHFYCEDMMNVMNKVIMMVMMRRMLVLVMRRSGRKRMMATTHH